MQRNEVLPIGAIVELHPWADGENGPHESDLDQPVRAGVVMDRDIHSANATWVLGYTIMPTDAPRSREQIKPGAISRVLATPGARRTVIAIDSGSDEPLAVVYNDEDQANVLRGIWPDIDVTVGNEYRVDYDADASAASGASDYDEKRVRELSAELDRINVRAGDAAHAYDIAADGSADKDRATRAISHWSRERQRIERLIAVELGD